MDINLQRNSEIEQFLFDVRNHFKASLETSEYENTSNLFHMTAAEATEKLLERCERLLAQCATKTQNQLQQNCSTNKGYINGITISAVGICMKNRNGAGIEQTQQQLQPQPEENVSYLYMSASKKKLGSIENIDFKSSGDSDKTFHCCTRIGEERDDVALGDGTTTGEEDDSETDADPENIFRDEDPSIYDICHVAPLDTGADDETQKAYAPELELIQAVDCPYMDLPAGHLTIQKSTKYGQLQRIEKRLFFDQSKKCYCGILNDWLLCYADGPTSSKPTLSLHLKSNGIQIEHSGEGKRRDICFQITTAADPAKRFVFQANNEVDAKEWIHAIEAAIRGDHNIPMVLNRKLPTPPIMKRMAFISNNGNGQENLSNNALNDYIYEEPSPLYHIHESAGHLTGKTMNAEKEKPPELPGKNIDPLAIALTFEYDIPKSPPQPLASPPDTSQTESETVGLLNLLSETDSSSPPNNDTSTPSSSSSRRSSEKLDFQTKIKDVHSKLSSQLSAAGPNLKKAAKKTYSYSSTETADSITPLNIQPSSMKDNKKQKKSNTPNASPQKCSANVNNNNSNNKDISAEKSARNWFLNRLNKTTSSTRSNSIISTPTKCKQSEKENLLNNLEISDNFENNSSSNPASPIFKNANTGVISSSKDASASAVTGTGTGGKSKVNLIIKEFEANNHLFTMETLAGNAMASLSSFCDSDCNNYEPIMTVSTPPSSFMKKV